jgi:hypothetical protein
MNLDMVLGIARHVLTFGGGLLVTKGIIDEGTMTGLVGAVLTIIGAVWSIVAKKASA